jgi:putative colanic acid biosynthesis UDP-glucose lipid carrier transferase
LLAVLSPILVLAMILVTIESPGGPLFRQRRGGYQGAPFLIYKFRTMRVQEDGPDIAQARRGDERVTRLGGFLRKTSIDELPQLLNVLRGEMSLVGPRPHALCHDQLYEGLIANYRERFQAKPGLTGLAQTSGLRGPTPDVALMAARVEKDLEYIRGWSLMMDVKIMVRTVIVVAARSEAF